jgi:hypothetical protein
MSNIAIFYHVGQIGNWQEVYLEQMNRLATSGILNDCKHFHIGINGTEPLPFVPENAHIQYNNDHVLEANTLEIAAVNVVLPWSTCPIVPMLTCGLERSKFSLAIFVICYLVNNILIFIIDPMFGYTPFLS